MEFLNEAWSFIHELLFNTQDALNHLVNQYDTWVYAILFIIIFCETGLVVTPFLPGDSLLFLAGAITANPGNSLHIYWLLIILIVAAIIGDAVNYTIGRFFGDKLFSNPNSKIFKQEYLEKTHHFYEKHGGKTIIIARFVPIVRTFAPFVAGMGKMTYKHFFSFNVIGGVAWVVIFCLLGYFVGGLEIVQNNLKLVVVAIIVISILPGVYEVAKAKLQASKDAKK
ncbi:DedA family protein [Dysgonomonas sp. BGC7]|uniref:DedA family protein n=1 Tax=Dysgonomonas sp. BGC7 TaxID=1658008 RepID=UPI000682EF89|nr:DedA family protein [Dysgonomonas sp. BGC7]MBD8389495.1 DedA family protein [Dysgonomonas sp. BGC7]